MGNDGVPVLGCEWTTQEAHEVDKTLQQGDTYEEVIENAELLQLPAPEFLVNYKRTNVIIYGPRSFKEMNGSDRIRACYQHCVLQWVMRKQMTNKSLRERFGVSEGSGNVISRVISDAVDQGLVKNDPNAPESKRYARYIPAWA
jgi:predicted HTH transcriptional regulator